MKELFSRESYALFPDKTLRRSRPNIHAKKVCEKRKPLTNQEIMPSQYYTSYVPFISSVQKEDLTPVSNDHQQRVGERKFLPTSRILICISETMKNTSMPYVLALICFMLFNLSDAWAQSAETRAAEGQAEITPLQIGDTIPEELWNLPLQVINHPDGRDTITLNDYRDSQLIILDFWSSWCGPCVRSLPSMNKVYDKSKNGFPIFLVTRDSPERIAEFEGRIKDNYEQKIPYLRNALLEKYFPFKSLPQNVWINKQGLVICFAMGDMVTQENMKILNW